MTPPESPSPEREPSQKTPALAQVMLVANDGQPAVKGWALFKAKALDIVIALALGVALVGVAKLYDRQSDMQTTLAGQGERLNSIDSRLGRIEQRVDRVEQKLDTLIGTVNALAVQVAAINTKIDERLPARRLK